MWLGSRLACPVVLIRRALFFPRSAILANLLFHVSSKVSFPFRAPGSIPDSVRRSQLPLAGRKIHARYLRVRWPEDLADACETLAESGGLLTQRNTARVRR